MAELRSSDVLAKQDKNNKDINNRLVDAEGRLKSLERRALVSKEQQISSWELFRDTHYYCDWGELDWRFIMTTYANNRAPFFEFYLRLEDKTQLSCTKIELDANGYNWTIYFGDLWIQILEISDLGSNLLLTSSIKWPNATIQPCQLIVHYFVI